MRGGGYLDLFSHTPLPLGPTTRTGSPIQFQGSDCKIANNLDQLQIAANLGVKLQIAAYLGVELQIAEPQRDPRLGKSNL